MGRPGSGVQLAACQGYEGYHATPLYERVDAKKRAGGRQESDYRERQVPRTRTSEETQKETETRLSQRGGQEEKKKKLKKKKRSSEVMEFLYGGLVLLNIWPFSLSPSLFFCF